MADKLYEVVNEGRFEINFKVRTMEDATGVLYTNAELQELYNDGEEWNSTVNEKTISCPKYVDYRYEPQCLIFLDDLVSHVRGEFSNPKKKEVFVDLSDSAITQICNFCQKWLKQQGMMCRPSTGAFIRFKVKPKKVEVKKSVLWRLKGNCVMHMNIALNKEYGLDMDWKGIGEEKVLRNYVKFGMKLGYTVETILCGLPFYREWRFVDVEGYYEYYPLNWFLTHVLFKNEQNQQQLIELYIIELRKWLDEIALL